VYKALLAAARSPPRLKRWRPVVRPEFTGSGATPHRWANAASCTSRFGLSPAVTSSCPATSVPTPSSATSPGGGLGHHDRKRLVELGDLLAEQQVAVGDAAQRSLGRCNGVGEVWTGTQPGGRHHQLLTRQRPQGSSQRFGGADHQAAKLVAGGRAGLHRPPPGHPQRPDRLHAPIAALGNPGRRAGQRGPGSCLGVDGIRLALTTPGTSVRPVDLHHGHACLAQVSQQSSAISAGSLHPDPLELTQAPQPGQQGAVVDFPRLAGHSGYAAIVDGDGLRVA
jgi:hypothetical protein